MGTFMREVDSYSGHAVREVSVTNGTTRVSLGIRAPEVNQGHSVTLDPDQAIDLAIALLNAADHVRHELHGSADNAKFDDLFLARLVLNHRID